MGIKLFYSKISKIVSTILSRCSILSPRYCFLFIFSITAILVIPQGVKIGEDICYQVKSTQQYADGISVMPNYFVKPDTSDLSKNNTEWQIRPPGASWFALPGLSLGFSLGHSISISLFVLGLVGGFGWIALAKTIGVGWNGLYFLSLLLGISQGLAINHLGTMNSVLYSFVPWMIIFSIYLISLFESENKKAWFKISAGLVFFALLGFFGLIKTSGMIVAITIGSLPIIILLILIKDTSKKFRITSILLITSPLIMIPYLYLEKVNKLESGISSDTMYRKIDYAKQSGLWGNYFTESTQGWRLGISALGSPGYAISPKIVVHKIRDFVSQSEDFKYWSNANKINQHSFICGLWGIGLALLVTFYIIRNKKIFSKLSLVLIAWFFTVPFLGLAIVSFLHGFNYSLYATHTIEYSILLLFPVILIWERTEETKLYSILLTGLLLVVPLCYLFNQFTYVSYPSSKISSTEHNLGLSESRFSEAIGLIEKDSKNPLDILFFLPAGDTSDLILRTKMRALTTHFSGDNFHKMDEFKTFKQLNVYCAYDSSLTENKKFIEALDLKFPQKTLQKIIYSSKFSVLKITLSSSLSNGYAT